MMCGLHESKAKGVLLPFVDLSLGMTNQGISGIAQLFLATIHIMVFQLLLK